MEEHDAQLPVKAEPEPMPVVAVEVGVDPLVMAAQVERALEGKARILRAILSPKLAGKDAFVDMNGKPWLPGSAAQRIAGPVGICVKPDRNPMGDLNYKRDDGHDEEGAYFDISISGIAYSVSKPEQTVTDIGVASSKKNRFRRRDGRLPVEAISEGDVRKDALTNLWARLVQALLGLRGLTWEELEAIGHHQDSATHIAFDGGKAVAPAKAAPPARKAAPARRDKEDVRPKIRAALLEMTNGDPEQAAALLETYTGFEGDKGWVKGVKSVNDKRLTDSWAYRTWGTVKEKLAAWKAQEENPMAPPAEEQGQLNLPDEELAF